MKLHFDTILSLQSSVTIIKSNIRVHTSLSRICHFVSLRNRLKSYYIKRTLQNTNNNSSNSVQFDSDHRRIMSAPVSAAVSPATVSLPHLLSACLSVARRAGDIIRGVYAQGKHVSSMVDKRATPDAELWVDPQTEADVRAQNMIITSLKGVFPALRIIGEEEDDSQSAFPVDMDTFVPDLTSVPASIILPAHRSTAAKAAAAASADSALTAALALPMALTELPLEGLTVWVDPLDGTREFTLGHVDNVTTLIGISYKGAALGGVVHAPFLNQTVYGAVGMGVGSEGGLAVRDGLWATALCSQSPSDNNNSEATQSSKGDAEGASESAEVTLACYKTIAEGQRNALRSIGINPDCLLSDESAINTESASDSSKTVVAPVVPSVPSSSLTVVTSRNHMTPTLRAVLDSLQIGTVLQVGGAGSKGLRLLTGAAHAYVFPQGGTKRWDTCAVHALVTALGGTLTDAYGGALRYDCDRAGAGNQRGVLATLGCTHGDLVLSEETQIYRGEGKL